MRAPATTRKRSKRHRAPARCHRNRVPVASPTPQAPGVSRVLAVGVLGQPQAPSHSAPIANRTVGVSRRPAANNLIAARADKLTRRLTMRSLAPNGTTHRFTGVSAQPAPNACIPPNPPVNPWASPIRLTISTSHRAQSVSKGMANSTSTPRTVVSTKPSRTVGVSRRQSRFLSDNRSLTVAAQYRRTGHNTTTTSPQETPSDHT
jgi:hypothetical protein